MNSDIVLERSGDDVHAISIVCANHGIHATLDLGAIVIWHCTIFGMKHQGITTAKSEESDPRPFFASTYISYH